MTVMSLSVVAQQSYDEAPYEACYNLTTETHCFKTDSSKPLKNFTFASNWCKSQPGGYFLVRIEREEVQAIVERFLIEFELTSDDVWIGANRDSEGRWTWVDGQLHGDDNFSLARSDIVTANFTTRPALASFTVNSGNRKIYDFLSTFVLVLFFVHMLLFVYF